MNQEYPAIQSDLTNDQIINELKVNGELIENFEKTPERCLIAIRQNGMALKLIPYSMQNKELVLAAISQNANSIQFVAKELINAELCNYAVSKDVETLKYIPKRFKDDSLYISAMNSDWHSYEYVPRKYYNLKNCLLFLEYYTNDFSDDDFESYKSCLEKFPRNVLCNSEVVKKIIDFKLYNVKKSYNRDDKTFYVKYMLGFNVFDEFSFSDFKTFYEFVDFNLDNAFLRGYDFDGIDLSTVDLSKAQVDDEILDFDVADDINVEFFYEHIKIHTKELEESIEYSYETMLLDDVIQENIIPDEILDNVQYDNCNIYYISDLHLIHKLNKHFCDDYVTRKKIKEYIKELVIQLVDSAYESLSEYGNLLLIAGDVSLDYNVAELFYEMLVKYWDSNSIVVVLGNHDFWDKSTGIQTLNDVVYKYKQLFNRLGINFLHNDLLVITRGEHYPKKTLILRRTEKMLKYGWHKYSSNFKYEIISEDRLKSMNANELRKCCLFSMFSILGGVGFSGLCKEYNAINGLYREKIQTLEGDIKQTERFENVYKIVNGALANDKVIVLTHNPKDNWTTDDYNKNWVYINGHTHRNYYCIDDEKEIYADNQVGYYNKSLFLKYFSLSSKYDIFRYYKDGKYTITKALYEQFYRGKGLRVDFNQNEVELYMLKRNNLYCFLCRNRNTGVLYFLKGGVLNKIGPNRDLDYFYYHMIGYSKAIECIFCEYYNILKKISSEIKRIGGTGTIHGCIVDIDFSNHIYININDGKITPYYATSITDKYIYDSVPSLLKKQRKDLFCNYIEIVGDVEKDINQNNALEKTPLFVNDTSMYKSSRVMKDLQCLLDDGIIRVWNDDIVENFIEKNCLEN